MLLGQGITQDDLSRAGDLLTQFVKTLEELYGVRMVTLNVHNLTHLVQCVRMWGPLWSWSCFAFESFNGDLKKSVHGTGNVCRQIFWSLQAQKKVENLSHNFMDRPVKDFLQSMCEGHSNRFPESFDAYQCGVVKPRVMDKPFTQDIKTLLQEFSLSDHFQNYMKAYRVVRNDFMLYSKGHRKGTRRNSYTVMLERPSYGGVTLVEIEFFLLDKGTKQVFAVGRGMRAVGSLVPRRSPHLQKYVYNSASCTLVPAELLKEPVVIIHRADMIVAAMLPNHVERD